jgi:hypothetical protein
MSDQQKRKNECHWKGCSRLREWLLPNTQSCGVHLSKMAKKLGTGHISIMQVPQAQRVRGQTPQQIEQRVRQYAGNALKAAKRRPQTSGGTRVVPGQ